MSFCSAFLAVSGCGGGDGTEPDAGVTDGATRDAADTSAHCSASSCVDPGAAHCDPASGTCVECVAGTDCPAERGICHTAHCGGCLTRSDCMTQRDLPICRADGRCVACDTGADCPTASPFCSDEGACVECHADADCSQDTPACVSGTCTSCATATCTADQKLGELIAAACEHAVGQEGTSGYNSGVEALFCSNDPDLLPLFHYIRTAVGDGRVTIDVAALPACASSADILGSLVCTSALHGTVVDAGACLLDIECMSHRCVLAHGTCGGTCAPPGPAHAPCGTDTDCATGLACIETMCTAPPSVGMSCTSVCTSDASCNASHVCEARHDVGGDCARFGMGGDCLPTLACISSHCAAPPTTGMACWPDYLLERCAAGQRCDGTTCRMPAVTGGACTTNEGCAYGSRCIMSVCTVIIPPGGECTESATCALGTGCRDGRCRPLPDIGASCFADGCLRGQCQSGRCTAAPLLSACTPGPYSYFDVLDPCGSMSSCTMTSGGSICTPEGGPGAPCGAPEDPPCRVPDLACASSGTCGSSCS